MISFLGAAGFFLGGGLMDGYRPTYFYWGREGRVKHLTSDMWSVNFSMFNPPPPAAQEWTFLKLSVNINLHAVRLPVPDYEKVENVRLPHKKRSHDQNLLIPNWFSLLHWIQWKPFEENSKTQMIHKASCIFSGKKEATVRPSFVTRWRHMTLTF